VSKRKNASRTRELVRMTVVTENWAILLH
jgi:hypothetical protein